MYKSAENIGKPYSAVIMDLTIPGGMGGKEAAQHILAFDPEARLIVSSGYSNDPVMAEYAEYGFSAVLTKPYNEEKLSTVLRTVIAANQQ
jgi:CheY-like chemotaxis protein